MTQQRIYISGQISGLPYEEAKARFRSVELDLRNTYKQAKVINPMRWCLPKWMPWATHMILDLIKLSFCTDIFLMDDWENSYGARIEHLWAMKRNMGVLSSYDKAKKQSLKKVVCSNVICQSMKV